MLKVNDHIEFPFRVLTSSLIRESQKEMDSLSPTQIEYIQWLQLRRLATCAVITSWRCWLDDIVCWIWFIPGLLVQKDLPVFLRPQSRLINKEDELTKSGKLEWSKRLTRQEMAQVEDLFDWQTYQQNATKYHKLESKSRSKQG